MRVIIEPDYQKLSQWAANYVASKINAATHSRKPFVLGCPTGSSPLGMYKALIELNKQGVISFQNIITSTWTNMSVYPKTILKATTHSCGRISSTILISRKKMYIS